MLDTLSPETLEKMAVNILNSEMQDFLQFHALAEQIVFKAMQSPEAAATWSQSLVALMNAISEPGSCSDVVTEPLGGSSGPGKAFRFALLQECLKVFEEALADVEYCRFLPTDHPDYLKASSRIWAFGHLLCTLVNWKVLRDTALNFCLKRLLGLNTFPDKEDVPMTCIEIAAKILEAVDPWMEHNWGYTSSRHLDAYYFRMQHWCERQIFWSNMPEGCFVDLPFCHDILDKVVNPRMQWIHQKREQMAPALELPDVDVAASEATGRRRVPPIQTASIPVQPQPSQELNKTEREYSGEEDSSYFAFSLLPIEPASAAAPVAAAYRSADEGLKPSYDSAMFPVSSSCEDIAAVALVADSFNDDTGLAPTLAPVITPAPATADGAVPTTTPVSAPAAAAANVGAADDLCIAATADLISASSKASLPEHPQINETPADISISSDSASSQSAESMYAPRSHASSGSSGTSHSSSGDTANSPDSHSSSGDTANSPDGRSSGASHSSSGDTVNSPDSHSSAKHPANSPDGRSSAWGTANSPNSCSSRMSTRAAESGSHAQSIHNHRVSATASDRLPLATHKGQAGAVGCTAPSSQSAARISARTHAHTHAQTQEQQIPIRKSNAQLGTMSSNHPRDASVSGLYHHMSEGNPPEDPACLSEAVSRVLHEFMLSHDSVDFKESLQVLLGYGNAVGVLQTLLQSATAKLEELAKPKPFSKPTPLFRSRKALQRHFEEQRDRIFCRGGVIDPLAFDFDFNQHTDAKGRRSGLGYQIPPSNPGYKLMMRYGWQQGRGLGANLQGRTEPFLPAFQPLNSDNAKQGLGELCYKGMLRGDAAAHQLRELLVSICSGESAVMGGEAVQQGLNAFLTNATPCAIPHAAPLRVRTLCWVGSILGALVFKGTMTEKQASSLVTSAARASAGPGGSTTLQRLTRNMWAAVGKQRAACGRAEEQAVEEKQTETRQLAELYQPQAPSRKTSYVQGATGKTLKIKIKQYGGAPPAAPSSDGRVSWE